MPNLIDGYLQILLDVIGDSPIVRSFDIFLDKRTLLSGFVRGDLYFLDGTRLHFRELIEASDKINKHMYSYHYQEADGALIFRYDDIPHHEGLPGFPHHKHSRSETNVVAADPPELIDVLNEIQSLYPLKRPNTS